jgi:tripartite-type tricarboxylate transporter receptor subunit TctC
MQYQPASRIVRNLIAVLCALTCALSAKGQGYPARPVTLIVPYPAGNASDLIARQMAPLMRHQMGQPLIVENVAGAGGGIGVQRAFAGQADGYVVVLGSPNDMVLAPLAHTALAYRAEQFRLVGVAIDATFVLVGRRHSSGANLDALLAAARRPGARELNYGTFGEGSLPHLIGQDFAARLGLRMLHVPYRGTPQVLQDLIGGQIDLAFMPLAGTVLEHVAGGRLIAYAVTSARRHPVLPAVPTADENAGLIGFRYNSWLGLFVKRDVPEGIVARLHGALQATLLDTQFRQGVEASGSSVAALMTLPEAQQHFIAETSAHRSLAKRVGALPGAEPPSTRASGASGPPGPGRR